MATGQIPEADYQKLREFIGVLDQRVTSLEERLIKDEDSSSAFPNVGGLAEEILRITKKMFPGEVSIHVTDDPESPQDSYTVVHAQASSGIHEIEDRRVAWHEQVAQLSGNCRLLRLSLEYRS